MAQRRPRDQRVVRNRRVAIYTFLLILTLFYISAHRTVQKEREMEALRAETAAEGPGEQVKELAEGWPGGIGDMKAQGLSPIVCSGYRTLDKQEKLFNRKVLSFVKAGHTKEESYNLARQTISIPGSGEHCLGLAVDFYTRRYHKLERAFEDTPESKWLVEHAQDYGFVMRYGENKTDITGIQYEPWHYRYVGVEAAKYMKENELSLEEFYIEQSLYG